MSLKNFLARLSGSRRGGRFGPRRDDDGGQGQAGARGPGSFLPGLRAVSNEVDAYFKDVFAAPARGLPTTGRPPPASGRRTTMRAPKMLPWIARKAGLNDELALKLWRRAAGEAEELCGDCDSSEYHAAAVGRFLDLVGDESEALTGEPAPGTGTNWIWRHERRMAQLNMLAMQDLCRLWQASWCAFLPTHKPSPLRLR